MRIKFLALFWVVVILGSFMVLKSAKGNEEMMIPTIPSNQSMHCEKVADLPLNNNKVYRCANNEVICYITAPEAQQQCFKVGSL